MVLDAKKGGYDPGEEGSASPYPGQGRRYEEMGDGQGNAEGGEEEDAMAAMMGFGGFGTTKVGSSTSSPFLIGLWAARSVWTVDDAIRAKG